MAKAIAAGLALVVGFALVGCGSADDQYATKAPPTAPDAKAPAPMLDKQSGASTHHLGQMGAAPGAGNRKG
jgi:hypothetical protein